MPPKKTKTNGDKPQKIEWEYNGETITEPYEDCEGFIYCIYNDTKNMFYIGRKSFYSYSKKKLTPTEKQLPENKRKTFKIVKTNTTWRTYTGSCQELNQHIKEGDKIRKVILRFCKQRKQMTAWETKYILCDCFGQDNCYNGNVLGKIFKTDFED
jgi:hypothetical protein